MIDKKDRRNCHWTFLTNHAHVVLCLEEDSTIRIRDIALKVGITERAVQRIISELTDYGYITIEKQGRNNIYNIHRDRKLMHSIESHKTIDDLIKLIHGES